MTEVRYNRNHHAGSGPEQRIANRLRNSGDAKHADNVVQKGDGPTRTFSNIHSHGQGAGLGRGPRFGDKQ
jgi:hypothetical protein